MATHELYVGGPANPNQGLRMFPAAAFSNAAKPFTTMDIAQHKQTLVAALTRTLAFGTSQGRPDDPALAEYVRTHVIAANDVLDLIVIPANTLLLGTYYNVENPQAGVALAFTLDDATTFGGANQLAAPVQAAGSTVAVGGTVTDGDHFYVITAITALGETTKSNEIKVTAAGGNLSINTLNWGAVAGATGYRAYRGVVTGVYTTYIAFGAVVTGDDTGAAGTAGTPPTTNTSGNSVYTDTASSKFSVPNGAAWVTAGSATLANANFSNVPRMLGAKVVALGAAGFGSLRVSISPLVVQLWQGQY
jgi:hypothetical protein